MVGDYINIMKTTFDFNFDFYQAFKRHGYKKHGNKENLSVKIFSISLLVNLQFEKSFLTIKTYIKRRLHSIDIIAYHRITG